MSFPFQRCVRRRTHHTAGIRYHGTAECDARGSGRRGGHAAQIVGPTRRHVGGVGRGPAGQQQVFAQRRHGTMLSEQFSRRRSDVRRRETAAVGGRSGERGTDAQAAAAAAAEHVDHGDGEHQGTGEDVHAEEVRATLGTGKRQREVHPGELQARHTEQGWCSLFPFS